MKKTDQELVKYKTIGLLIWTVGFTSCGIYFCAYATG